MKSSTKTFNEEYINTLQKEQLTDAIEYIDDMLSEVGEADLNLMFLVLKSGEKILCIYDMEQENVLYLPIHLVDYVNDNGTLSYLFYPYHNVADVCSELILSEQPSVMSAPSQRFIEGFFDYWAKIKSGFEFDLKELNGESLDEDINEIYPETLTLS